MFPANTNSVKLKKIPFSGRFQPQGEDFCVDLPRRRGKIIQPCPNWRWEPPHLCGGRSALELRERVSPLITRFCSGNAKTSLIPGWENRRREPLRSLGPEDRPAKRTCPDLLWEPSSEELGIAGG